MSKVTKNVVMVFTLACVVVLVIFCVELFLLNRDNGDMQDADISNNEVEVQPTDGEAQIADDPFQNGIPDETEPIPDPPDDNGLQEEIIRPPADTRPQVFALSEDIAELLFYVDMASFEREDLGESRLFTYIYGEDAWLEVGFAFVQPGVGTRDLAQTFLHNYLEGDYSTFEGERTIGNSAIRGVFITGESEGGIYDAWLRDLSDLGEDSLALIVVVRHSTDEERDMLYSILDTMSIQMLIEEDPEEEGEEA